MDIYSFISLDRCIFLAKTLDDVKIMKVLYDHVFFFNNEDNNYNYIDKIKKCEFCNNLEMYIRKTFSNKPVKCAHGSSYAICVEYNEHLNKYFNVDELSSLSCENDAKMSYCPSYSKLQEHVAHEMTPVIEKRGELMEIMQDKTSAQGNPENPEGNNIADKNVIGSISVLGISCILFFLYKSNKMDYQNVEESKEI
ncbi:PIR Superfamily Protein [Plasmodium ovale curtisi]|nr:PIR Superfamily Protein [Plasmodium ovale curtisi]